MESPQSLRVVACVGNGPNLHPLMLLLLRRSSRRTIASPFGAGALRVAFEVSEWQCSDFTDSKIVIVVCGFWDHYLLPREKRIPDAIPFSFDADELTHEARELFTKEPQHGTCSIRLALREQANQG